MIKRFVKYVGLFGNDAHYVYYNSKDFYTVMKDGTKRRCNYSHKECVDFIRNGTWREAGPVVRKGWKYYKGQINPRKNYLFVEPDYIWFADGARIIKDKLHKGYTLKTKNELDNECFVGKGKFLIEID